ncbi:MAG: hypothetical protein ACJA1N_002303 [Saprospiraceae bacterium]|jgi:hypothetical protein
MKNSILIFLLFPTLSFAQIVAFDCQYKGEDGQYTAKLSTHNQIITMVDGMTCDDFFLTTDNGTLQRSSRNCTWNYMPHRKDYGWIYFNKMIDGKKVIFHKKRLEIQLMRFEIMFAPFQPDNLGIYHLTEKEFKKSRLYMMSRHKFYEKPIMITHTEIRVIRDNRVVFTRIINQPSREIYTKHIAELEELAQGDIITFTNIKYQYPSENDRFFVFDVDDIRVEIR